MKYKVFNQKPFCSNRCIEPLLPKCFICKTPFASGIEIHGTHFCKKCSIKEKCFSCGFPATNVKYHKDMRPFCTGCLQKGIFENDRAEKIYKQTLFIHGELIGVPLRTAPDFKLMSFVKMQKNKGDEAENGRLRGFYNLVQSSEENLESRREEPANVVVEEEVVVVVNGLQEKEFVTTLLHELTHDWLSENFPGVKVAPLWYEEGLCQYLTFQYTLQKKWEVLGRKIMNAKDDVYGKGFKYFKNKYGFSDWRGVLDELSEKGYNKPPPFGTKRKE